jgi:hypothetical protein
MTEEERLAYGDIEAGLTRLGELLEEARRPWWQRLGDRLVNRWLAMTQPR